MGFRLILFDLDGTLLDADKHVSAANRAALCAAAEKGIELVPSTGRFYDGMPQEVRDLPHSYAITINGAAVVDARSGEPLHREEIPLDTALRLFDEFVEMDVYYDCYQDNWGWTSQRLYDRVGTLCPTPWQAALLRSTRTPVDDLRDEVRRRGRSVQKIQEFFPPDHLDRRDEELARLTAAYPELSITSSVPNNIEINSKRANKGSGLLFLCEELGCDPSETMAFGDGLNDVSMLEDAGVGVAMANAGDRVKAIADYVTTSNLESGIAHALHAFDVC